MPEKTIELGTGASVTLVPADGWAILKRQAISERLKEFTDGSITLENYVWYYAMCSAQVKAVKGIAWQPPEAWATPDELRANFEAWMKALPDTTANIDLWLTTIGEVNNPVVADELAPGGEPQPDSPKAKKGTKPD